MLSKDIIENGLFKHIEKVFELNEQNDEQFILELKTNMIILEKRMAMFTLTGLNLAQNIDSCWLHRCHYTSFFGQLR